MRRIIASSLIASPGCIIGIRNKGAMSQRSGNFLAGLLVGLLSTGLLLLLTSRPRGQPVQLLPLPTPLPLRVHVSGAVSRPGVYELAQGAIVEQAIEAAGGSLAAADLGSLNLAAPLHDGPQAVVHQPGEAQPPTRSRPPGGGGGGGSGEAARHRAGAGAEDRGAPPGERPLHSGVGSAKRLRDRAQHLGSDPRLGSGPLSYPGTTADWIGSGLAV